MGRSAAVAGSAAQGRARRRSVAHATEAPCTQWRTQDGGWRAMGRAQHDTVPLQATTLYATRGTATAGARTGSAAHLDDDC